MLVLATAAPLLLFWTATRSMGYFADDGPAYLMMARHYSPFMGESPVNAAYAATSRFPPLYPSLLGLSGAAGSLLHTHLLTTLFLLAGLVVYYGWLRELGLAPAGAALLVLLLALIPETWLIGLEVQSEYLYLPLSLLALLLLERHARLRSDEWLYAAALVISMSVLTRTIGIALFAPLLVAAWRSGPRTGLLAIVTAILPPLLWHLLHRSSESYTEALGNLYGRHAASMLWSQLSQELPALRAGFSDNFQLLKLLPQSMVDLLALLCLTGLLRRALRLKPDGLYLLLYLAIVWVWPYPDEAVRFLWAVTPVALASIPGLVTGGGEGDPDPRRQGALVLVATLMLLMALPSIALASRRYRDAVDTPFPSARDLRAWYDPDPAYAMHAVNSEITIREALIRVRNETPADSCVVAIRLDLVNFYAERGAARPPLNSVPDPLFQSRLRSTGCRYVFMASFTHIMFPVPLHPLQRLQGMIRVLDYVDVRDPPPGQANAVTVLAELQ